MTTKRFDQLPDATLPLDGTELAPLWQSGATVQTPIANLSQIGPKTITTDYAMTWADRCLLCDATVAGFILTLPDPTDPRTIGIPLWLKRIDQNGAAGVVVSPFGLETIDGFSAYTLQVVSGGGALLGWNGSASVIMSDGTNWWVLAVY